MNLDVMVWFLYILSDKPKQEKQDSFAEKLASNIIKNLQVEVSNIHIRYEDRFTNPAKPVSIGVTLRGLSFQVRKSNIYCKNKNIWRLLYLVVFQIW